MKELKKQPSIEIKICKVGEYTIPYTIKRLKNTPNGHPNYEIVIYPYINDLLATLGTTYHVSTYNQIEVHVEKFIRKLYEGR